MASSSQPPRLDLVEFLAEELEIDRRFISPLTRKLLQYIISGRDPSDLRRHKTSKRIEDWPQGGPDWQRFPYSVPAYAPDQHHGDWILTLLSYGKFPETSDKDECRILDFSEAGCVVLKDNNSHSYEATPSKLRELGSRLREEWREWLEEISKNNTIQESLDLESRPGIAKFRFIFLSKLESLTKEELMQFFVSHNLSLQYFDMALIDDGFSWLGSSTLYHLDKPASFDLWYRLPIRISLSQQLFRDAGLPITVGKGNLSFPRTDRYLFRRSISIYFRYEYDTGRSTIIVSHVLMDGLQNRFLESFKSVEKLQYSDNPFRIHGIGVSYVLQEWKRAMILVQEELTEIERETIRFNPNKGYSTLTNEIHGYLATVHRVTSEMNHLSSVLQSIRQENEEFCRKILAFDPVQEPKRFTPFDQFLFEALQKVNAWHILLEELTKRAETSAGLLFNKLTATLAVESRRDTVSMKIIAFFTMIYLPGSFVSSIFGWSIINFSVDSATKSQTVVVGEQWKIYVTITVSLTVATFGAFYLFQVVNGTSQEAAKGAPESMWSWGAVKGTLFKKKEKAAISPRDIEIMFQQLGV